MSTPHNRVAEDRGTPTVSRSRRTAAPAERVYRLVTDLDELAALGDEVEAMQWRRGTGPEVGNVFTGRNRNGARRWSTRCVITDAEPGVRFAFDVRAPLVGMVSHWRYDLTADADGGCDVTESTWDLRPAWFRRPAGLLTGERDRRAASARHIEATLTRLVRRAEDA